MPAYYRWSATRHKQAQYVAALRMMAHIEEGIDQHKDLNKAQIEDSEAAVLKAIKAFSAFLCPFDGDIPELVNLSSGRKVQDELADEILKADENGQQKCDVFIKERLKEKSTPFNEKLKKSRQTTFSTITKEVNVRCKTSNKELKIKCERNMLGQLLVLSMEHEIDIERVLTYPLTQVPFSLASSDGAPLKTNKSTLLHKLENTEFHEHQDLTKLPNTVSTIDGNALFHSITDLPSTFGDLAKKILKTLPNSKYIHFVTDTYKANSIKDAERERRGKSKGEQYLLRGPETKVPRQWKDFLRHDSNKKALINFLYHEWQSKQYATDLKNRELFFCK